MCIINVHVIFKYKVWMHDIHASINCELVDNSGQIIHPSLKCITHTHSSPAAGWEEEGRTFDHGPVGQVDEHDTEADRDAFLGKEERKRLDNMPPEKAKQEMRCVCVCVCVCVCLATCKDELNPICGLALHSH